jgi:hypothetical protein
MTELSGPQRETLRSGLQKGYPQISRFKMFLREQLNKRLEDYTSTQPLPDAIFSVVEGAEAEGWLNELVLAAYRTRKNHPEIEKVAVELGVALLGNEVTNKRPLGGQASLAPLTELQDLINPSRPFIDSSQLWRLAVEYPGRICKIEAVAKEGTGFLVGSDLVLTNHHVMVPTIEGEVRPEDVVCRFDYAAKADGSPINQGLERRLIEGAWLVSSSPPSKYEGEINGQDSAPDELDFCLIRLASDVGSERLGGSSDPSGSRRGWFPLNELQSIGQCGQQLFILQHPMGAVLKLAIGDQLQTSRSGNRFSYNVNTLKGSSGSPVFNARMEVIGLHQSGQTDAAELAAARKSNQGIPISNIARFIRQHGINLQGRMTQPAAYPSYLGTTSINENRAQLLSIRSNGEFERSTTRETSRSIAASDVPPPPGLPTREDATDSTASLKDVLFDVYSRNAEQYYTIRQIDGMLERLASNATTWIHGPNGVGKTAAIMRFLVRAGLDFKYINLSPYSGERPLGLLHAIHSDICIWMERNDFGDCTSIPQCIHRITATLRLSNRPQTYVFIEEIPSAQQVDLFETIKALYRLITIYTSSPQPSSVSFIFSSVQDPTPIIKADSTRLFEKINFLRFELWEKSEIEPLIDLITDSLRLLVREKDRKLLTSAANGSPRFIKIFFRHLGNRRGSFSELLTQTQNEVQR